jgi:hypothetical protein
VTAQRHASPDFGPFEGPPYVPGGPGGEMKCPTCQENTPDAWEPLWRVNSDKSRTHGTPSGAKGFTYLALTWMHCANEECGQLVIRAHQTTQAPGYEPHTVTWNAYPRAAQRPVDPLVPEDLRRDYNEAAAILDISPRMSAVLSRRILAELLRRYTEHKEWSLTAQVDGFRADSAHPSSIRENLHHLREVADFGAHEQTDKTSDQPTVLDTSKEHAEWTLNIVDRLFDYLIVGPERDRKFREEMDGMIEAAGRKPISPLPDEGEES